VIFQNLSNRLVTHAHTFSALDSRNFTVFFAAHFMAVDAIVAGLYMLSFSFNALVVKALAHCFA